MLQLFNTMIEKDLELGTIETQIELPPAKNETLKAELLDLIVYSLIQWLIIIVFLQMLDLLSSRPPK